MSDQLRSTRLPAIQRRWNAILTVTPPRWDGIQNVPRAVGKNPTRKMPERRQILVDIDALFGIISDLETRLEQAHEEGRLAREIMELVEPYFPEY